MTKLGICISEIIMAVLTAMVLILCIAFFNGSNAETTSSDKYQMLERNIVAEYKSAKIRCNLLLGNVKALCNSKAEGLRVIAKAELEASFTPTIENRYDANLIRADATFAIAKEQCGSMKDAEQEMCEKVAKESHACEIAIAEAERDMEKSGEIKKDNAAKFNEPDHKRNPFITIEFDNIYHVKA